MKRLFALLAALMIVPVAACGEGILVPGWEESPVEALLEARNALNDRIDQLNQMSVQDQALSFSGHGQAVIPGFDLSKGAWAYQITLDSPVTGSMVICENGKKYTDRHFNAYKHYAHAAHYKKPMTIDYITMDFDTDWELVVQPISILPSADANGSSSGVSGFFLPSSAQQVEITVTASDNGYYTVDVLEANFYRTNIGGNLASHGTLESGESQTDTYLLTPDKDVYGYVWIVNAPDGFTWSISAK